MWKVGRLRRAFVDRQQVVVSVPDQVREGET